MATETEREPTAAGAGTATEETRNASGEQVPAADAASNDASSDDNVRDEKAAAGLTKRQRLNNKWQKLKSHVWRFKWWYLLAIAILLAILLPLLFTVIIPAIVQDILNDQKLPIYGGALQVMSPSEVNMSIDTQLKTPIAATLKPTDLFLYSKETKPISSFFKLEFPEVHIHSHTNVSVTNQTLKVTNETELTKWFNVFFDKPDAELSLHGKPEIKLGSLSYHRSLKKTVDIPSLNYLDGFALKSLDFDLNENRTSKYNMKGMLNIPNAGVLRLGLGNLTFNVMSGDINLGLINLWDLQLWPGNNSVPFDGNFFFDQLVPNLKEILDMQGGYLNKGVLGFNATGNTTKVGDQHIKYIEGVLNYKHIPFTFPVITLLGDVIGGLMDGNSGSLLDVLGTSIGNTTLLEHVLGHWDNNGEGAPSNNTARSLVERSKTRAPKAWMWSLLRLGLTRKSL
ncbi:hypothetical protein FBEOM_5790 [Fusarium beomiforme]|uniref:Uncharacterized protein n=1 Tax=Fusarium beomiforme TaxID=44412 RepID=A0A9P5AKQ0_9HYPO|nr:hypothetical protein FBEOM_5790 [Fusarium beomiforme]